MNGYSRRQRELTQRILKRDPKAGRMVAAQADAVALLRALIDTIDGYVPQSPEENGDLADALGGFADAVERAAKAIEIDVVYHKHCVRCFAPTMDELNPENGLCDLCDERQQKADADARLAEKHGTLTVTVGFADAAPVRVAVADLKDAAKTVIDFRDEHDMAASDMCEGFGIVSRGGRIVAVVSYNGKVAES
jgi:hypothetical protein